MKETDFARYLTQFLSTYLPGQVGSKRNTQLAYRDSFSLFLRYCRARENLSPEKLTIAKVDRELVFRFLQWLEDERNCKAATRNQRLAAIHSFFSFLMVEEPQYIQQSQKILAIPMKKADKPPLMYLPFTLFHPCFTVKKMKKHCQICTGGFSRFRNVEKNKAPKTLSLRGFVIIFSEK